MRVKFLIVLLLSWIFLALPLHADPYSDAWAMESDLINLLQLIENGNIEKARQIAAPLKTKYPGSRAIQLIYGDIQNLQAMRPVSLAPEENYSRRLLEILTELKTRLRHTGFEIPSEAVTANIVKPSSQTRHIIAVDLSLSRLYLFERQDEDSEFILREHHYVSIGQGGTGKKEEGDLKTPIGIYRINDFKFDKELPELYGFGAFTLDFPNHLDQSRGIEGTGIWLHGIPHWQSSRPPLSSEGCVTMNNALVQHLLELIDRNHTPVILADSLNWLDHTSLNLANPHQKLLTLLNSAYPDAKNLEIFLYPDPAGFQIQSPVFQVRFLQDLTEEKDQNAEVRTQYWRYQEKGEPELLLDTGKGTENRS